MKIAYFVNSFEAINWGGQATSNGIKFLLNLEYPNANFTPLKLPPPPVKKIKFIRTLIDKRLVSAILNDNLEKLIRYLKFYSINENYFSNFTHICFNGEGAIHAKSGHFIFLMALLYLAKRKGLYIAAINQTIDTKKNKEFENLLIKVYSLADFLSVREPLSLEYAHKLNLTKAQLIPDAAYGLPSLSQNEIEKRTETFSLPSEFIAFTGSSFLKRNNKSLVKVRRILQIVQKKLNYPILFLANAKSDIWLAHKLKNEFNFTIIEPPVKYLDAIAIISKAKILIGGRQHPNIFAYEYHVPYVPFQANTQKNIGVIKLQQYPIDILNWDTSESDLTNAIDNALSMRFHYTKINIQNFKIFGEN